jgi:hypothetical protein
MNDYRVLEHEKLAAAPTTKASVEREAPKLVVAVTKN